MPRRKEPRIPDAILDQLPAGADPKTAFDPNGLLDDLKKALAERVLNAEMDHHLAGEEPGNRRNGYGKKTVIAGLYNRLEVWNHATWSTYKRTTERDSGDIAEALGELGV